jgi:hypothetical protein
VGCGTGSLAYFAARTLSVVCGVALAAPVSSFIAPWYASTYALEIMSDAYVAALELMLSAYARQ